MNAILLTSGANRQAGACAPCVSPQPGGATAGVEPREAASVKSGLSDGAARGYRKWRAAGAGVETALFISVQAVMIVCIVLVAAQLFAIA